MNVTKISGLAAIAGLLLIASPVEHALAAPLAGPGIAAAVQSGAIDNTTEVRWHRHWHRHWGWHHRHWGWRHRWHHRHWRHW